MDIRKARQDVQDTALQLFDLLADDIIAKHEAEEEAKSWSLLQDDDEEKIIKHSFKLGKENNRTKKELTRLQKWWIKANQRQYLRGKELTHLFIYVAIQLAIVFMFAYTLGTAQIIAYLCTMICQWGFVLALYIRFYVTDSFPFATLKEKKVWRVFSSIGSVIIIASGLCLLALVILSIASYFVQSAMNSI